MSDERRTFWLADPIMMAARPVVCRPSRDFGSGYWEPVKPSDRRYLRTQFFRERWEAEADIVLQRVTPPAAALDGRPGGGER